jgi:hypothetical protein
MAAENENNHENPESDSQTHGQYANLVPLNNTQHKVTMINIIDNCQELQPPVLNPA